MDKKGQAGLGLAGSIIMALLILAILGTIANIVLSNMRDSGEAALPSESRKFNNGSTVTINGAYASTGHTLNYSTFRSCSASIDYCQNESGNATGGHIIASGNYTVVGCNIKFAGTDYGYNNTGSSWVCSWTASYKSRDIYDITTNTTTGTTVFFEDVKTWMTILGVVVLLLIISVIIVVVKRFSGGGSETSVGTGLMGGSVRQDEGLI